MKGSDEIERKFLVQNTSFKQEAYQQYTIAQGYLNTDPNRSVRIRIRGTQGYITVKGPSSQEGTSRFEWEKKITQKEAHTLLKLCQPGIVEKTRYLVKAEKHVFEVDVFSGDNAGLVVAEVELQQAQETFYKPEWLGTEVTGDPKYYNAQLSKCPFQDW